MPIDLKTLSGSTEAKARGLWQEFRAFALKGNMVDMAVAVVLGTAFGAVINSLVKHIIMPTLSYVVPAEGGYRAWKIGRVEFGEFLGELLHFFIIALALYIAMVKFLGSIQKANKAATTAEPTTKECPLCLSLIPIKAKKCAHCTADLPEPAPSTTTASPPPGL